MESFSSCVMCRRGLHRGRYQEHILSENLPRTRPELAAFIQENAVLEADLPLFDAEGNKRLSFQETMDQLTDIVEKHLSACAHEKPNLAEVERKEQVKIESSSKNPENKDIEKNIKRDIEVQALRNRYSRVKLAAPSSDDDCDAEVARLMFWQEYFDKMQYSNFKLAPDPRPNSPSKRANEEAKQKEVKFENKTGEQKHLDNVKSIKKTQAWLFTSKESDTNNDDGFQLKRWQSYLNRLYYPQRDATLEPSTSACRKLDLSGSEDCVSEKSEQEDEPHVKMIKRL